MMDSEMSNLTPSPMTLSVDLFGTLCMGVLQSFRRCHYGH